MLGFNAADQTAAKKSKLRRKKKSFWPDFVCSGSDDPSWGGYDEPDPSTFDVRGRNYLDDRIKIKSKNSLLKLANLELYSCGVKESYHIASHPKSWYSKNHHKLPEDVFYFVYNMQLASLDTAVVATFVIKTNQPPMDLQNTELIKDLMNDIPSSDNTDDEEELCDKMNAMKPSVVSNGSDSSEHKNDSNANDNANANASNQGMYSWFRSVR